MPPRRIVCSSTLHCASSISRQQLWRSFSRRRNLFRIPSFVSDITSRKQTEHFELPRDVPLEEERLPNYSSTKFYPARLGEVLDNRFKLVAKIGFGRASTNWLVVTTGWASFCNFRPYAVIKICENSMSGEEYDDELKLSEHIKASSVGDKAIEFVRVAKETFEITGPHGRHLCLVFEPLREPIWLTRARFGADKVQVDDIDNFKHFIRNMLEGLRLLHDRCEIIHTDLKLDNILVTIEDYSILRRFLTEQAHEPVGCKTYEDRSIYRSYGSFGDMKWDNFDLVWPKITDFGLAQRLQAGEKGYIPIQPLLYTAPEVLLGIGWSYSAEIWNFGLLVWNLLHGEDLWQNTHDEQHRYSALAHLANMVTYLGPVPQRLVAEERRLRHLRWEPKMPNMNGQLCDNTAEYFGGPFFDDDGQFLGYHLVRPRDKLKDIVPDCIALDGVDSFLDFIRSMLQWCPEERSTAGQLLEHPWLVKKS